jgi:hypothetical protein
MEIDCEVVFLTRSPELFPQLSDFSLLDTKARYFVCEFRFQTSHIFAYCSSNNLPNDIEEVYSSCGDVENFVGRNS